MKRILLLAALTLGASAAPAAALAGEPSGLPREGDTLPYQTTAAYSKSVQVDDLLAPWSKGDTPGAAVLVIQKGQILMKKGYGLANLESKTAIGPDTAFDLASVSKQFTSMALLILAERGKLSFDDPLSKFFPEFPSHAQKTTVKNLLNHTSGLPDYMELFVKTGKIDKDNKPGGFEPTSKDALELLAHQPELRFAPGDKWEYSNSGYMVLAQIIEKASRERYAQFLKENIFQPLGMNRTLVYDDTRPEVRNRAISYERTESGYKNIDYNALNLIYGDGNVNTTVQDMYKWDQVLYTKKLIKQSTLLQAFTSGKLNNGKETGYGFGWGVADYLGLRRVSHSGGWAGFRTHISRFPAQRFTVVVLSNLGQFNPGVIANKIAKIYLAEKMTFPVAIKVGPEVLQKYVGRYELAPDDIATVSFEDGSLWLKPPQGEKDKLVPISETDFFVEDGEEVRFTFHLDKDGNATSLTRHYYGDVTAPRRGH